MNSAFFPAHRNWAALITLVVVSSVSCAGPRRDSAEGLDALGSGSEVDRGALRRSAEQVLDDWHQAASVGDRDRYLDHFAPDAVFLGTDQTERWNLAELTAFVDEHFEPGKGWTYVPFERDTMLEVGAGLAWFDELLSNDSYGVVRGTGVLRHVEGTWRIVHYSLTFVIPNGVARDVVELVRSRAR